MPGARAFSGPPTAPIYHRSACPSLHLQHTTWRQPLHLHHPISVWRRGTSCGVPHQEGYPRDAAVCWGLATYLFVVIIKQSTNPLEIRHIVTHIPCARPSPLKIRQGSLQAPASSPAVWVRGAAAGASCGVGVRALQG
ncbi:hypothetical protein JTE90_029389 [Oedothorax gibbosus]|uniref:Uncharacterized protein n=1 Tax=Oedothorax gibbosus TaxID=931172 RepID=A0AAV6VNE9_9ARAC|nr:hypothetical protein JTE90_029389 [Oedothorax gibbosus]